MLLVRFDLTILWIRFLERQKIIYQIMTKLLERIFLKKQNLIFSLYLQPNQEHVQMLASDWFTNHTETLNVLKSWGYFPWDLSFTKDRTFVTDGILWILSLLLQGKFSKNGPNWSTKMALICTFCPKNGPIWPEDTNIRPQFWK